MRSFHSKIKLLQHTITVLYNYIMDSKNAAVALVKIEIIIELVEFNRIMDEAIYIPNVIKY